MAKIFQFVKIAPNLVGDQNGKVQTAQFYKEVTTSYSAAGCAGSAQETESRRRDLGLGVYLVCKS